MTRELGEIAQHLASELARHDDAVPHVARRYVAGDARGQTLIAASIDHTLLRPTANQADIERLCDQARDEQLFAVCVNPVWVPLCRQRLEDTGVRVVTVAGFPLGANRTAIKAAETALAVADGADEIDMVVALGPLKSGDWRAVRADIEAVIAAAASRPVKVIIESAALVPVEIVKASELARELGAAFVKTSTGFSEAGGATTTAVALIRATVGAALGVKASGGIRDCESALRMLAAGASRLGTSNGAAIARCLGSDPLPLSVLMAAPGRHLPRCAVARPPASTRISSP